MSPRQQLTPALPHGAAQPRPPAAGRLPGCRCACPRDPRGVGGVKTWGDVPMAWWGGGVHIAVTGPRRRASVMAGRAWVAQRGAQHLLPSGALTLGVDASGPPPYMGCRWPSPPAYCEEVASRCFTSGTGHSTVMKPAGHGWAGGLGASGSWKPSGRGSAPGSRDGGHTGPEMGDEAVRGGDGKGRVQKCPVL